MAVVLTFCNYIVEFLDYVWNDIIVEEHHIVIISFFDRIHNIVDDVPVVGDILDAIIRPIQNIIVDSFPLHTPFYVVVFSWVIGLVVIANFLKLFR